MVRWLNEKEMQAWYAFIASSALMNRYLDQQLKQDVGLSHLQYEILVRLNAAPEREMRMTELATTLFNSKSGLTYQITQMEKTGLVRRRNCAYDGHAVFAVLTEAGAEVLERAAPGHVTAVREHLIDALTPEQLTAIADGLGECAKRMLADTTPWGCGGGGSSPAAKTPAWSDRAECDET